MAFDVLPEPAKGYITQLAGNLANGTHTADVTRFSGTVNDPRARIVQKAVEGGEDFTLYLEGYAAGEAFQRILVKGFMTGDWLDSETWEGKIDQSAVDEYNTD